MFISVRFISNKTASVHQLPVSHQPITVLTVGALQTEDQNIKDHNCIRENDLLTLKTSTSITNVLFLSRISCLVQLRFCRFIILK